MVCKTATVNGGIQNNQMCLKVELNTEKSQAMSWRKNWNGHKYQTKTFYTCANYMLTLLDKVCHMMYLHKFWGGALLVQKQQRLQKLFPTYSASSLLPTQADSALRTIHKHRKRKSATDSWCCWFRTVQSIWGDTHILLAELGHLKDTLLYLKHLIESWAAAGDGLRRRWQRFQASLTHIFELQHGFLTADNLCKLNKVGRGLLKYNTLVC